ncbi:hypothetical protein BC628DRAFT_1445186 [Trametes gibbosa]|nr:hypothetical protein BC628DRAFT_1445186 [Trametes gibbosa]
MPSFTRYLLLALLAAPAALALGSPSAVPIPPTRVRRSFTADAADALNPAGLATRTLVHNPKDLHGLTNGQRLARGLPPRSPAFNTRRRRAAASLVPRQSAAPCALSQPTGTIRVADAAGNALGFVGRSANNFGEYGVTQDASDALTVVVRRCDSNDTPFDIEAVNGLASFPYVGAVVGFASTDDNIRAGSFNYAYIAGAASQVAYGRAQPVSNSFSSATTTDKDAETAIWTLSDTNALALTWVNTDGGAVTTPSSVHLLYVPGSSAFTLTGDVTQFVGTFGEGTEVAAMLGILPVCVKITDSADGPM